MISSSGGARMQEAAISLMQLAKTSSKLAQFAQHRLPFISILTDPTTGGVTASYGMLGDINIAEPKALIAFAGSARRRANYPQKTSPRISALRIPARTRLRRFSRP